MSVNPIVMAASVIAVPIYTAVSGDLESDSVATLISNVGFPIAVTIYVLYRLEAKMSTLCADVAELVQMHRAGRDLIKP